MKPDHKKRELIFAITGMAILLLLLLVVIFTIIAAQNILKTSEAQKNPGGPVIRFNFEKLKDLGIVKE